MADESKKKKSRWLWPLGVTATGLTGAAAGFFATAGFLSAADQAMDPNSNPAAIKANFASRIAWDPKDKIGARFYGASHTAAHRRAKFAPNSLSMRVLDHP